MWCSRNIEVIGVLGGGSSCTSSSCVGVDVGVCVVVVGGVVVGVVVVVWLLMVGGVACGDVVVIAGDCGSELPSGAGTGPRRCRCSQVVIVGAAVMTSV